MIISDEHRYRLKLALPWPGSAAFDICTKIDTNSLSRSTMSIASLYLEAYNSFLAGCPRASTICSGELVHRVLVTILVHQINQGHTVEVGRGKQKIVISHSSKIQDIWSLQDYLTFHLAIREITCLELLPQNVISELYYIKEIRNCAVHSDVPQVDKWPAGKLTPIDTNLLAKSCKTKDEFSQLAKTYLDEWDREDKRLRKAELESEVYRVWLPSQQIRFDGKKHICNDLDTIDMQERCAAIQFSLATKNIEKLALCIS